MEKTKLSVTCALKHFNKVYRRSYKLSDVSKESGIPVTGLSNLSTETSFRKLYTIAEAIFQLYPEMSDFDFSSILLQFSEEHYFWV